MSEHQAKRPEEIRVMLQDIGDPLSRMPWPPTPEGLLSGSIEPIEGSGIDVYAYGIYHAGGCTHDSKVYQKIGDNIAVMYEASGLQMYEGVKRLAEQGYDPLQIMCEGAHAVGKDFFLRMRMNDLHDRVGQYIKRGEAPTKRPKTGWLEPYYYTPQWRKEHPEWLIGDPDTSAPQFTFESFEAGAPNYLHAPVREIMFGLASEAVCNYDIDGFEIDFIRFPYLFPWATAWAHRHVMTAFIRKLREMIDEQARQRGRPIIFSARVPDTVELSLRMGLDLETWFAEGLLDMCVISGGYAAFTTPWADIVSLARKHELTTLACFRPLGGWGWRRTEQGIQAEPTIQQQLEHIRAATYRAYQAGVTGVELWNQFYEMPHYYAPSQQEGIHYLGYGFTHELADIDSLAGKKKAYLLGGGYEHNFIYGHASWCGQLPLMITPATDGIGQTVTFDVGDDLSQFPNARAELWINIVDLFFEDVIEFEWNGQPLLPRDEPYLGQTVYSNREFCFDIPSGGVKPGSNEFTIYLRERTIRLEQFVTLDFARLSIDPEGSTPS